MTAAQYKEVLKELREIKGMYANLDERLHLIELANQAAEMYKKALKQVYSDQNDSDDAKEVSARTELYINLGKLAGLLVIAVGAYVAGKGLH
jgi:hypothetical protein